MSADLDASDGKVFGLSEDGERLGKQSLEALAAVVARPGPGPAAGAVAAAAAALAAGLGEKVAHSASDARAADELAGLRVSALGLASEDTAAFAAFRSRPGPATRDAIVDVPVRIAQVATEITETVAALTSRVPVALYADARAVTLLGWASARCMVAVLEANLDDHTDSRLTRVREYVGRAGAVAADAAAGSDPARTAVGGSAQGDRDRAGTDRRDR